MTTITPSFVGVPVETDQFRALLHFLDSYGSLEDPVRVVGRAIDHWIEHAAAREELLHSKEPGRGYRWKELFLPDGSELRMRYRGEYHYAKVAGDTVFWNDAPTTPSRFANELTRTSRNAWRDLEVKRPGLPDWQLAQSIRHSAVR